MGAPLARLTTAADGSRVARWYAEMAPCWLGIDPPIRRRLVLRTHRWLSDAVFGVGGLRADVVEDLGPQGRLTRALEALVPVDELPCWRSWIRLVRYDLRRALWRRPTPLTEAWCRWMFLIPYSVPVSRVRLEDTERRRDS